MEGETQALESSQSYLEHGEEQGDAPLTAAHAATAAEQQRGGEEHDANDKDGGDEDGVVDGLMDGGEGEAPGDGVDSNTTAHTAAAAGASAGEEDDLASVERGLMGVAGDVDIADLDQMPLDALGGGGGGGDGNGSGDGGDGAGGAEAGEGEEAAPSAQDLLNSAEDLGLASGPGAGGADQPDDTVAGGADAREAGGAAAGAAASAGGAGAGAGATIAAAAAEAVDVAGLYNQLFESDDEGEEFELFDESADAPEAEPEPEDEVADGGKKRKSSSTSQARKAAREDGESAPSRRHDSDVATWKKQIKEEKARPKRAKDSEDVDNKVEAESMLKTLLDDMQKALLVDKQRLERKQPAVARMLMLPRVVDTLRRKDVALAAEELESDSVLQNLGLWLRPLGGVLPNLTLRNAVIELVVKYAKADKVVLLKSKIGQVCMTLLRHPEETGDNKAKLRGLCDLWFRIIDTGKHDTTVSSERRRELAPEMQPTLLKKRRASETGDREGDGAARALRPGDPGFIMRARVPQNNEVVTFTLPPQSSGALEEASGSPIKKSVIERRLKQLK